jgi:hypothetical protein
MVQSRREDPMTAVAASFDAGELEAKVKAMYRDVAERPEGKYHFEIGRALAERLGYSSADLDRVPAEAIQSFAGVGHYFHLADLYAGEMGRRSRQRFAARIILTASGRHGWPEVTPDKEVGEGERQVGSPPGESCKAATIGSVSRFRSAGFS